MQTHVPEAANIIFWNYLLILSLMVILVDFPKKIIYL